MTLDRVVEDNLPDIIDRFVDEVRGRDLPARPLSREQIVDELTLVLGELVTVLRKGSSPRIESQTSENARAHGRQRWGLGYHMREVIAEYAVLRHAILDVAAKKELVLSLHEVEVMSDFLTTGIADAAGVILARLQEKAEEAVRARDEVIAVVSHDLRNPLSSVVTAAELLNRVIPDDQRSERMRRAIGAIRRATGQMRRLVDDLLDLGAIESRQLRLNVKPEPADEIVAEALDGHAAMAREQGVGMAFTAAEGAGRVTCDRERIFQVFTNLISNALKFTPAGSTITLAADAEEGFVRFAVADEGPGIEDGDKAHLFDSYWRGRAAPGKGRGLGLAIVRGIVEAHGGTVGVSSEKGKGSTFYFRLPVAPS
jgi:signal transduction histidine kinase